MNATSDSHSRAEIVKYKVNVCEYMYINSLSSNKWHERHAFIIEGHFYNMCASKVSLVRYDCKDALTKRDYKNVKSINKVISNWEQINIRNKSINYYILNSNIELNLIIWERYDYSRI